MYVCISICCMQLIRLFLSVSTPTPAPTATLPRSQKRGPVRLFERDLNISCILSVPTHSKEKWHLLDAKWKLKSRQTNVTTVLIKVQYEFWCECCICVVIVYSPFNILCDNQPTKLAFRFEGNISCSNNK